jgi:DNA-binding cell septation regulator SpoVG
MLDRLRLHDVAFAPASATQRARGVLGFVTVSMNGGVRVYGFTVVTLPRREYDVHFPTRRDDRGRHHDAIRPLGPAARRNIVRQILGELRRQGVIP